MFPKLQMGLIVPFEDFRDERMGLVTAAPHYTLLWTIIGLTGGPVIPFVAGVSSTKSPKVHVMVDALMVEEKLSCISGSMEPIWNISDS